MMIDKAIGKTTGKAWQDAVGRGLKKTAAFLAVCFALPMPAGAAPGFVSDLFAKPIDPGVMTELALCVFLC